MITPAETYELHEHAYLNTGGREKGNLLHSHEGGETPHTHPGMGPSCYNRHRRRSKRPFGPQLPYVAPTPDQETFNVVWVDEYTPGHAGAGISRERWEAERAAFLAGAHSITVERLVREFRARPVFELRAVANEAVDEG